MIRMVCRAFFKIDLVTVFDAILTSRQTREKLKCFYENVMSNNFRKKAVLKKKINCKLKLQSKGLKERNFGGVPELRFLQRLALDSIYLSVIFPGLSYSPM